MARRTPESASITGLPRCAPQPVTETLKNAVGRGAGALSLLVLNRFASAPSRKASFYDLSESGPLPKAEFPSPELTRPVPRSAVLLLSWRPAHVLHLRVERARPTFRPPSTSSLSAHHRGCLTKVYEPVPVHAARCGTPLTVPLINSSLTITIRDEVFQHLARSGGSTLTLVRDPPVRGLP